jgi:hypothetical protein
VELTDTACCSVVELRQYTLHDHARDTLVRLFDGHLIEAQESAGMHIIGQFRDRDDERMFVWLRGFTDMDSRREVLKTFYRGPIWRQHSNEANATMVDSDNVLLLRPIGPDRGLPHPPPARPGLDAVDKDSGGATYVIDVFPVAGESGSASAEVITAQLRAAGLEPLAWYGTEPAENTFPALPVREGERVIVAVSAVRRSDAADSDAPSDVPGVTLTGPVQRIRCNPTGRSQLR